VLANALPLAALAHSRSQSFSTWTVADTGDVRLSFSVSAREVTRLATAEAERLGLGERMARHLSRRVSLRSAGRACPPVGAPRALAARPGHVRVEWRFECPPVSAGDERAGLEISVASFFDVVPSHLHFARVSVAEAPAQEFLFHDAERTRTITRAALRPESRLAAKGDASTRLTFRSYLALGVEHILSGADHLAFLLALLLLSRRAREVALLVTGFTVGHSVTLSLAALSVLVPDIGMIEALIGFTIALVAAEGVAVATGAGARIGAVGAVALAGLAGLSFWKGVGPPVTVLAGLALFTLCYLSLTRTRDVAIRLSPVLSMIFGLVHGFGFASVLMEVGLPRDRLVPALLGFNIGVELGQLAIVAVICCAGALVAASGLRHVGTAGPATMGVWQPGNRGNLARLPASLARRLGGAGWGRELASAVLCGLGLFWFVDRAYGG